MRIPFERILANSIMLFAVLIGMGGRGQAQGRFPPDDHILAEVTRSTVQVRAVLNQIDFTKLPVEYREGRLLERQRQLVFQGLHSLDEKMATLKQSGLLTAHYEAMMALNHLDSSIQSLSSALQRPVTYVTPEAERKLMDWAEELIETREGLQRPWLRFHVSVLGVLMQADLKLKQCEGKNE